MFEGVVISIIEKIFTIGGKGIFNKISIHFKRRKAKKALLKKVNDIGSYSNIEEVYVSKLDSFLVSENFVQNLMNFSFNQVKFPFQPFSSYLKYLLEKFIEEDAELIDKKT